VTKKKWLFEEKSTQHIKLLEAKRNVIDFNGSLCEGMYVPLKKLAVLGGVQFPERNQLLLQAESIMKEIDQVLSYQGNISDDSRWAEIQDEIALKFGDIWETFWNNRMSCVSYAIGGALSSAFVFSSIDCKEKPNKIFGAALLGAILGFALGIYQTYQKREFFQVKTIADQINQLEIESDLSKKKEYLLKLFESLKIIESRLNILQRLVAPECPICFIDYSGTGDRKRKDVGCHGICTSCYHQLKTNAEINNKEFLCPICQQPSNLM